MLSVLICTYNRPQFLMQCLRALLERTVEKPNQVVVVNSGGAEADHVVESFKSRQVDVKLVKTKNRNLAASRNVGLPHCTGDVIAMTDDDAEVFPDWVMQMKKVHAEKPEVGAVGGPVFGSEQNAFLTRVTDRVTFPKYPMGCSVRTIPGVNVSYKRSVIEQVGAQDETLFRGEDVDYNWRVFQLGYEIYYEPSIRVYHHHRSTLGAFFNQHFMYGRAYYLLRRKWLEMYCVYPHSLKSFRDLLRALNFIAAIFYEPFSYAAQMERMSDKFFAYPVLLANQLAWRGGMVWQKLTST